MIKQENGRPRVITPGTGPDTITAGKRSAHSIITRAADNAQLAPPPATRERREGAGRGRGDGSKRRPVLAPASAYAPLLRRTWWAYAYGCRACGSWHLGRARTLDEVTGPRRARCGHWVTIMIARIYGAQA